LFKGWESQMPYGPKGHLPARGAVLTELLDIARVYHVRPNGPTDFFNGNANATMSRMRLVKSKLSKTNLVTCVQYTKMKSMDDSYGIDLPALQAWKRILGGR
jgi:hypothetical protein